jgi:hypothetical protein
MLRSRLAMAVLGIMAGYAAYVPLGPEREFLTALSPTERDAMRWVERATAPSSAFLVVTAEGSARDESSEWFPALAQRVSLATSQGYEWAGGGEFLRRVALHTALQACAGQDAACLETLAARQRLAFTHVYVRRSAACAPLLTALTFDPHYASEYDGAGAAGFRRTSSPLR